MFIRQWRRMGQFDVEIHLGCRFGPRLAPRGQFTRIVGKRTHVGSIFGIMVENGSEFLDGDEREKMKYRAVLQGNDVVNEIWETAICQDLGSAPAPMEAGKMFVAYVCLTGNSQQQADVEQAYVQIEFEGGEVWACLPEGAWPEPWKNKGGIWMYTRPTVRFGQVFHGHPDAGFFLGERCDKRLKTRFCADRSWPTHSLANSWECFEERCQE